MNDRDPRDLTPLTPLWYQILLALAAGRNHGYGLMKEVRDRTEGRINPATGTVYLALQRLEDEALIARSDPVDDASDDRRRYYELTAFGRRVASAETERLVSLVGLAAARDLVDAAALAALRSGESRG